MAQTTNDITRAVIFDFGGVLKRTMNPLPRRELERQYGLEPGGAEEIVYHSPLLDAAQLGHITTEEFWADVGQRLGLNEEETAAFRRTFRSGDEVDEELVAFIRHLRDEGYRTGLLSNAVDSLARRLEEYGFADAFNATVISALEGLMKPDPAIYELILARLGATAEEAIFIDDWRVNVEAARQMGMRALLFRGPGPLRKQLREMGIPVPEPSFAPLTDVQAVIFDWGGVMEGQVTSADAVVWDRRLGLAPGAVAEALWGKNWRQLEVGDITNDEYIQRVADQLGFPSAEAADHFTDEFYAGDRFRPEILAAVRALRSRYDIGLLTNAWPGADDVLREKCGVDVHAEFDVFINSAEVGLRKPDPAIYELALEQLDVAPAQTIFVDDLIRNVDSARGMGIHAVQFVDASTTLAELEALLGHAIGEQ
jgi:putative hydrolase of the HAD superfamily